MKRFFAIMLLVLLVVTCLAGPPDEQQLIGRWKTRESIVVSFTKEHTFTMKNPDLPIGAAGRWTLHPGGKLEMIVAAQLDAAMHQKPVPEQVVVQMLTLSGKGIMQISAPGGLTDTWTRLP